MTRVDLAGSLRELEAADDAELPVAVGGFLGSLARRLGADRVTLEAGAGSDGDAAWRFEYVAPGFETLRERYERASVRSAMAAPIRDGERPIGQLEVQAVRSEQEWSPEIADRVGEVAAELLPTIQRLMRPGPSRNGHRQAYVFHAPPSELARALDLAEQRYAAIASASRELSARVSSDLRVVEVNESASTNFAHEGTLKLTLADIVHPEDHSALVAELRALTPSDPRVTLDVRMLSSLQGAYRWHRTTWQALYDRDGELAEYQVVGRDVTRRLELAGDVAREVGRRHELGDRLRLLQAFFRLIEKAHGARAEQALARIHGPDNPLPLLLLRLVRAVLAGGWDDEAEEEIRALALARRKVDQLLGRQQANTEGKAPVDIASRRERSGSGG